MCVSATGSTRVPNARTMHANGSTRRGQAVGRLPAKSGRRARESACATSIRASAGSEGFIDIARAARLGPGRRQADINLGPDRDTVAVTDAGNSLVLRIARCPSCTPSNDVEKHQYDQITIFSIFQLCNRVADVVKHGPVEAQSRFVLPVSRPERTSCVLTLRSHHVVVWICA